jgi:hypothetical protein
MMVKFPVKNKAEAQFWIRAFQLEGHVDAVSKRLMDFPGRTGGFCPVMSTYEAGAYKFIYVLVLMMDTLGVNNAIGNIWMSTTEEHHKQAMRAAHKMGNDVLEEARKNGGFHEVVVMEADKDT